MSLIDLHGIRILDLNENDLFDGQDQILAPNGKALPPDASEVQAALKKLGIPSFQKLQSLSTVSQYLRSFRLAEASASSSAFGVDHYLLDAREYAEEAGIPFDEARAAEIFKKSLIRSFKIEMRQAEQDAAEGSVELVNHSLDQAFREAANPEVLSVLPWDPARAAQIHRGALLAGFNRRMKEAEQAASYERTGRGVAEPNPYQRVGEALEKAEVYAKAPEVAPILHFDAARALQLKKKALLNGFRGKMAKAERLATEGLVEATERLLREAQEYALHPEAEGLLRFNSETADPLRKKSLLNGFRLQWRNAEQILQGIDRSRMPYKYRIEAVEQALKNAERYSHDPLVASELRFDLGRAEQLKKQVIVEVFRLTLFQAQRNVALGYGIDALLEEAKGYASLPSVSSLIHFDPVQAEQLKRQAYLHGFKRAMLEARKISGQGEFFELEVLLKDAKEFASHPEVSSEIEFDAESASQLKRQALALGIARVLKQIYWAEGRDDRPALDNRFQEALSYASEAEFSQISLEQSPLPFMARLDLLINYRMALKVAKRAGLECNVAALDNLLHYAGLCASQAPVSSQLSSDEAELKKFITPSLRNGIAKVYRRAEIKAGEGKPDEVEVLLKKAKSGLQYDGESWALLLHERKTELLRKQALQAGIEKAFSAAEEAAKKGDLAQVTAAVKQASQYSERAGIPFDERRYGKILQSFQRQ